MTLQNFVVLIAAIVANFVYAINKCVTEPQWKMMAM